MTNYKITIAVLMIATILAAGDGKRAASPPVIKRSGMMPP